MALLSSSLAFAQSATLTGTVSHVVTRSFLEGAALRQPGYATDLIAAEAVQLIGTHGGFSTSRSTHPTPRCRPRSPISHATPSWPEKRRAYAAMITQMDDGVGRIVQVLEKKRLRDRTLIVFSSDNGGNLPAASSHRRHARRA